MLFPITDEMILGAQKATIEEFAAMALEYPLQIWAVLARKRFDFSQRKKKSPLTWGDGHLADCAASAYQIHHHRFMQSQMGDLSNGSRKKKPHVGA